MCCEELDSKIRTSKDPNIRTPASIKTVYNQPETEFQDPYHDIFLSDGDDNLYQTQEFDLSEAFGMVASKEVSEADVENYIKYLIGKVFRTLSEPLQIRITKGHRNHIIRTNVKLNKKQKKPHYAALMMLDDIIGNAAYVNSAKVDLSHNTSKKTLKHKAKVERYVYFRSPIKVFEKHFVAKLTTEQIKGQDPTILDLYNVEVKKRPEERNSNVTLSSGPENQLNESVDRIQE